MSNHASACLLGALAIVMFSFAPGARGEISAWDQVRVTALAKELTTATDALDDTFTKQPQPGRGSMQSQAYFRLKQLVRMINSEAQEIDHSLEKGEGREQTLPIFENLMQLARSARDDAARVFVAQDVGQRAAEVRGVLNQLGPYYDPDFAALAPQPNVEPGATR